MSKKRNILIKIGGTAIIIITITSANISFASMRTDTDKDARQMHKSSVSKINKISNHIAGTITAINGNSFTIATKSFDKKPNTNKNTTDPQFIINTTSTTIFKKDNVVGSITSLVVGQGVMITGTIDHVNHTATATNVDTWTNANRKPVAFGQHVRNKIGHDLKTN
jgi:hypothetical protein